MAAMTTRSFSPTARLAPAQSESANPSRLSPLQSESECGRFFASCWEPSSRGRSWTRPSDSVLQPNPESAWINGGSPTSGFLQFGTKGPFSDFYQSLAGNAFVDWIFMIGLLGVGVALLAGIGVRIAALAGALMLVMMWTAYLSPDNHPVLDDHLVYAAVLAGIAVTGAGTKWGFGKWWSESSLVRKYPFLK